jgi:hypothetical protein
MGKIMINFKKSKYHNVKVEVDGIKFDSGREAKRYKALKELQRLGIISELRLQIPYELCPAQYVLGFNGKQICARRSMKYIADFVYIRDRVEIVNDSKGFLTPEYKQKKNLMRRIYGIEILES